MLPRPLVIGLTVLIAIMWAVNLIVGFLDPSRSDPATNAIFAIVVGAVYALGRHEGSPSKSVRRRIARLIDPQSEAEPERSEKDDRGDQT